MKSRDLGSAVLWLACCAGGVAVSHPATAEPPRLDALDATRQRPLFSPGRRGPTPVAKQQAGTPPTAAPDVVLSAVVIGPDLRTAWLKRKDNKTSAVDVGGNIDGWTVTEISARQIVLDRDGRTIIIEFPKRGGPAPTPTRQAAR